MELSEVKPGSIILVERLTIDHYGVYAGNSQVIHYAQKKSGGVSCIHKASVRDFLDGSNRFYVPYVPQNQADIYAFIKYHEQRRSWVQEIVDDMFNVYDEAVAKVYTAAETLKRASAAIGEEMYNLLDNNCEHFAFWCKFKVKISSQIGRIFQFFNDLISRTISQRFHNCVICQQGAFV